MPTPPAVGYRAHSPAGNPAKAMQGVGDFLGVQSHEGLVPLPQRLSASPSRREPSGSCPRCPQPGPAGRKAAGALMDRQRAPPPGATRNRLAAPSSQCGGRRSAGGRAQPPAGREAAGRGGNGTITPTPDVGHGGEMILQGASGRTAYSAGLDFQIGEWFGGSRMDATPGRREVERETGRGRRAAMASRCLVGQCAAGIPALLA